MHLDSRIAVALLDVRRNEQVFYREDLASVGVDPVEAYLDARARLARVVRARLVTTMTVLGPWGVPCVTFHHPLLAASCLVLPDLHERVSAALGADALVAVTPRRDCLVVSVDLGPSYRVALRDVLRREEDRAGELTIFRVDPTGPQALLPDALDERRDAAQVA